MPFRAKYDEKRKFFAKTFGHVGKNSYLYTLKKSANENYMSAYHTPVMLTECLDGLQIRSDGNYVDVTFGGGGHSRAILEQLGPKGHLYSFDQDPDAEQNIGQKAETPAQGQFTFVRSNFRYLKNWMKYYGVKQIDGLLADLGVSSHHLDDAARGFAFRLDAPLDMRMNTRAGMTAADLLANYSEEDIARVLALYGELRQSRRMANALVRARQKQPIATTGDLQSILLPFIDPRAQKKELAQAFQALRIEVNHEMQALEEMLQGAIDCLAPGGRLVVMTYHSLEDRIVKNVIRSGHADGRIEQDFYGRVIAPLKAVNNKPIVAGAEEQEQNPRSRSAKLRIATRLQA